MDPRNRAVIGYKIGKNNPLGETIPFTISGSQAPIHLDFLHTLDLDHSGEFLTTSRSTYTLRAEDAETPIITYDFVRKPPNPYPEAHIHLHGRSSALQRMFDSCGLVDRKPADLHIPVGGRRFRPCLEGIIEFCILEELVSPREGWQEALERGRREYHEQQLRAAVRRFPEQAAEVLTNEGWQVTKPLDNPS